MSGMSEGYEIVACGLRPEGSFAHLAALVAFVWLAARLAPRRPLPPDAARR